MTDIIGLLPDSLNLPPHLSAHKYFFVCTLTVAAWDTLVLSPRAWRLMRTKEWPTLKIIFHFLRFFMPAEFVVVAVAFFDTDWSQARCQKFFLFEPIATAVLVSACSIVHVIRVHAIYDKSRAVLAGLCALFAVQVVTMGIASGFYRSVPLKLGQGCIAGPKENWVGIYWLAPTLLYTASFGLALARSLKSLQTKPLSYWKLMLRDGLNLYGAIWVVNMVNMLFWFIITPTGPSDTIKTIVTSMAAVLTTTMTLRIILSVRGSLVSGGSFAGSSSAGAHSSSRSHGTTHVISTRATNNGASNNPNLSISPQIVSRPNQTYTLEDMRAKSEREWVENDGKSSVHEPKEGLIPNEDYVAPGPLGVKITVDREVDFAGRH